jgi:hypothetical protein
MMLFPHEPFLRLDSTAFMWSFDALEQILNAILSSSAANERGR